MQVFNTLAPVFLIIALGAVLRRAGFLTGELVAALSRLTYWLALPALLFHETATATINFSRHQAVFWIMMAGMAACMAAGWACARLFRIGPRSAGTLVQAAYRGNLAFVGLPVIVYSFATNGLGAAGAAATPAVTTMAVLLMAAVIPVYNVTSVVVLLAGQHRLGWRALRAVAASVLTNPLIIACALGLGYSFYRWPLALAAERTLKAVGQMALPLALLSIGGSLELRKVQGRLGLILAAGLIKVSVGPLVGWALGRMLGLSPEEMRVALIYLACPTAAASFVMADQLGGDGPLAAGVIVASTALSLGALWIVVWLF